MEEIIEDIVDTLVFFTIHFIFPVLHGHKTFGEIEHIYKKSALIV